MSRKAIPRLCEDKLWPCQAPAFFTGRMPAPLLTPALRERSEIRFLTPRLPSKPVQTSELPCFAPDEVGPSASVMLSEAKHPAPD